MKRIDLPRSLVTRILQQIQRHAGTARHGQFTTDNSLSGTWYVHDHAGQTPDRQIVQQAGDLYLGVYLGTRGVLQMQGWRLENGAVSAVAVGIRED